MNKKKSRTKVTDVFNITSKLRECDAISINGICELQKAMGHSSINVSLTYLRGLEVAELKEEDMHMV